MNEYEKVKKIEEGIDSIYYNLSRRDFLISYIKAFNLLKIKCNITSSESKNLGLNFEKIYNYLITYYPSIDFKNFFMNLIESYMYIKTNIFFIDNIENIEDIILNIIQILRYDNKGDHNLLETPYFRIVENNEDKNLKNINSLFYNYYHIIFEVRRINNNISNVFKEDKLIEFTNQIYDKDIKIILNNIENKIFNIDYTRVFDGLIDWDEQDDSLVNSDEIIENIINSIYIIKIMEQLEVYNSNLNFDNKKVIENSKDYHKESAFHGLFNTFLMSNNDFKPKDTIMTSEKVIKDKRIDTFLLNKEKEYSCVIEYKVNECSTIKDDIEQLYGYICQPEAMKLIFGKIPNIGILLVYNISKKTIENIINILEQIDDYQIKCVNNNNIYLYSKTYKKSIILGIFN
jgi:hypothetical protein